MAFSQFFSSVFFVFLREINGWRGWVQALIFFAFMDTVFTLGFFLVRFSSYFLLDCINAVS